MPVLTVSAAVALVCVPLLLLIVAVNLAPLSAMAVRGVVYEVLVAPAMSTPFFCHCKTAALPCAVTRNVAVCNNDTD
jgi:hypothetical protein